MEERDQGPVDFKHGLHSEQLTMMVFSLARTRFAHHGKARRVFYSFITFAAMARYIFTSFRASLSICLHHHPFLAVRR